MKVERYRLSEWAQRVLNDGHAGTIAIASLCHAAEDALRVHAGPLPQVFTSPSSYAVVSPPLWILCRKPSGQPHSRV